MQTQAKLVSINQLGVTAIMQHATDASGIAVGFAIAFWHNFPHPPRYPVVQIEPMSYTRQSIVDNLVFRSPATAIKVSKSRHNLRTKL